MDTKASDWLIITVIAFMGGLVNNIIDPTRRGMLGFGVAAFVGLFCGGVAGISAHAFGAPAGLQYILSAAAAVFGDRALSGGLVMWRQRNITINTTVHGPNQQNLGDDVNGEQRTNR